MTTGKLEYLQDKGTLKLKINLFIDDFEAHLRKVYAQPGLNLTQNPTAAQSFIQLYTNQKLTIQANGQNCPLKITEITPMENNVLQVKYQAGLKPNTVIRKLSITNTLLFEAFSSQANVLHVWIPGKDKDILQFEHSSPTLTRSY